MKNFAWDGTVEEYTPTVELPSAERVYTPDELVAHFKRRFREAHGVEYSTRDASPAEAQSMRTLLVRYGSPTAKAIIDYDFDHERGLFQGKPVMISMYCGRWKWRTEQNRTLLTTDDKSADEIREQWHDGHRDDSHLLLG